MDHLTKRFLLRVASLFLFLILCGCSHGQIAQEQTAPWKFAVIADTQGNKNTESHKPFINEKILTLIADDIARKHPDFVLVAGDLVSGWLYNGGNDYPTQFAVWKEVMKPVYDAGIRVYPIRGNHEDGPERFVLSPLPADLEPPEGSQESLRSAFREAFDQEYIPQNGPEGEEGLTYSFSYKNTFIIGLDEYTLHQHKVNQSWIEEQIAQKTEAHLFVFGHEPAFTVNQKDNLSFYAEDRDMFWSAVGNGGGRVYFCGHDHMYNRAFNTDRSGNAIRQITVGTGGGRPHEWSGEHLDETDIIGEYHMEDLYGYVIVIVDGSKATIQWKAVTEGETGRDWKVFDIFSYDLSEKSLLP